MATIGMKSNNIYTINLLEQQLLLGYDHEQGFACNHVY